MCELADTSCCSTVSCRVCKVVNKSRVILCGHVVQVGCRYLTHVSNMSYMICTGCVMGQLIAETQSCKHIKHYTYVYCIHSVSSKYCL